MGGTSPEPLTEEEFAEFKQAMKDQGEELREALVDDLGGEPEDYRVDGEQIADAN
jgi:hypothetical protein